MKKTYFLLISILLIIGVIGCSGQEVSKGEQDNVVKSEVENKKNESSEVSVRKVDGEWMISEDLSKKIEKASGENYEDLDEDKAFAVVVSDNELKDQFLKESKMILDKQLEEGSITEQEKNETEFGLNFLLSDEGATLENTEEEELEEIVAKEGESLLVNDLNITVVSTSRYEGEINQFSPLNQDHAYLIEIIVENKGKDSKSVSDYDFKLYDSDEFEVTAALPSEDSLISAEIPGGKRVKGILVYDVPKQDGKTWELHYTDPWSFSNSQQAVWELPAK